MRRSLFSYHLPQSRIAQTPLRPRDHSRLLVLDRSAERLRHQRFYDLPQFLRPGDVLVFNNSKVFPARLAARKSTGGKLEILLLRPCQGRVWEVMIGGKVRRAGQRFRVGDQLHGTVTRQLAGGVWHVRFDQSPAHVRAIAAEMGSAPTPPYIKRAARLSDYQTVYARHEGSVAAPTAGFHFTKALLHKLDRMGVQREEVTLHVGLGTFQPVTADDITEHQMHAEFVSVNLAAARRIRAAKQAGRRIIAVGTTSVRVLETALATKQPQAYHGMVNTFIYPGYQFQMVDGMITNFHLPESTLLMLVSAFAGRTRIINAYKKAIRRGYRFYSFGDAMLLY